MCPAVFPLTKTLAPNESLHNLTPFFRLPPAMILVTRLDNRQTQVISRKTGFLRRADSQLETRARQYAEQNIRNVAMREGILKLANENGQARIAELAHAMGARTVRFEAVSASPSPSQ